MAILVALNMLPLDGGTRGWPVRYSDHWLDFTPAWVDLTENTVVCTLLVLIGCAVVERWVRRCKRMGRPCFQYHLTTALAATVLAAVLVWANTPGWEGFDEQGCGWPFEYASFFTPARSGLLLANAVLCCLVVLGFGILVEGGVRLWAKKRRQRRGDG
jgi:hypothetical protein